MLMQASTPSIKVTESHKGKKKSRKWEVELLGGKEFSPKELKGTA